MGTPSYLLPVVGAALVASVVLNVVLVIRAPDEPPEPQHRRPSPTPAAGAGGQSNDACRADLERCRQENWSVALRAMTAARPPASGTATTAPGTPPPASSGPVAKTGAVEQDDALTQMAREQVRLQWKLARPAIVPFVLHDLADPAKQEAWERNETQSMVTSANMSATQRERLERDFGPVRATHAAALRDALSKDAPDAAAAVAATKQLFASEDALMGKIAGDEAREKWRSEVMLQRTALVAVFAALGDGPWDKTTLAW